MVDFNTAMGGDSVTKDTGLNALLKQSLDSESASEEEYKKKIEPITKELETTKPPEAPTLPSQPKPEFRNQMESFGSAANWLAVFGSMLTRRPLINSLSASAGVMNAYNAQDLEKYKQNFDTWKQNVDNVVKMHDFERESYNDLVGKDEKLANIYAAAFKNPTLAQMAQVKAVENYLDNHDENGNSIKKDAEKLKAIEEEADEWRLENPKATNEEYLKFHAGLMSEAYLGSSGSDYNTWKTKPESIMAADGYASGVSVADLVRGRGKDAENEFKNIKKLAVERHPGLDLSKSTISYAEAKKEALTIAARSAPAKIAVKEMDNLAKPMVDAIKALDSSQFPDLNTLNNAFEKKTGGTAVIKAALAVQEFKTAFTNLMVRNGVPTDQARAKADDLMDKNFSLDQIDAVKDQAKITGAAVLDALQKAKDDNGTTEKPNAEAIFNDGSSQNYPIPAPKNNKYKVGVWYDTPQGVGKYVGNGQFEQ